jgi:hypothetical protein
MLTKFMVTGEFGLPKNELANPHISGPASLDFTGQPSLTLQFPLLN